MIDQLIKCKLATVIKNHKTFIIKKRPGFSILNYSFSITLNIQLFYPAVCLWMTSGCTFVLHASFHALLARQMCFDLQHWALDLVYLPALNAE